MRSLFLLFLLTLASLWSIAQVPETNPNLNTANNWIFGDSVWLKFSDIGIFENSLPLEILAEASSSYSNSRGELVLYSRPETLYDSNGKTVASLRGGNSSREGSLILKQRNLDSTFYILSSDEAEKSSTKYLYLSVFDSLNLDSSLILVKNAVEGLGAVNHLNNQCIWVASHDRFSDSFYFFLLKANAALCCPVRQAIGGNFGNGQLSTSLNGTLIRFSPNGSTLVSLGSESNSIGSERVDLFKFSTENGKLGNNIKLNEQVVLGCSFSNNSSFLYLNNTQIFQYDLKKFIIDSLTNSRVQITTNWSSLSNSQLGPNGKIYFANYDSSYLGVINDPSIGGIACDYEQKGLLLNNKKPNYGLPNFNSSYFYTPSIDFAYTEDCWEHSYAFEGRDTFDADGYKWLFRDVRNDTLDTRQGKNVMYTFPQADSLENKYEVSHIAYNANRADTVTKTLTIRPKWKNDVLGRDTFYCTGDSIKLILQAPQDMHCVHWNEEEPNLDEALGPIVDYDHFHADSLLVDTAGTYIVKVTNKTFCQMWDTIRVTEKPNPQKPNIQRISQELESTKAAAEYRWYYEGRPKFQNEISKIQPDSNGYWQVQLVSEYGCESELSDSLLVGFASVPSIKATNALSFNVYPNPSDGNISIKVPKQGEYNIQITDLNGTVVYTTKHNLNLSFEFEFVFAKGTYIVTLTDEEGNTGSKQIVVR
jgi:hypothetical protein